MAYWIQNEKGGWQLEHDARRHAMSRRRLAYYAALKYHFGYIMIGLGFDRRSAWRYAKEQAAHYAFNVSERALTSL